MSTRHVAALLLAALLASPLLIDCGPSCEDLADCPCDVATDCYGEDFDCDRRACDGGVCALQINMQDPSACGDVGESSRFVLVNKGALKIDNQLCTLILLTGPKRLGHGEDL